MIDKKQLEAIEKKIEAIIEDETQLAIRKDELEKIILDDNSDYYDCMEACFLLECIDKLSE